MDSLAIRDWIQIGMLLVACGVFVQQARTTHVRVAQHEERLKSVEALAATSAGLLQQASKLLDRVSEKLANLPCKENTTIINYHGKEIDRMHGEIEAEKKRP